MLASLDPREGRLLVGAGYRPVMGVSVRDDNNVEGKPGAKGREGHSEVCLSFEN